MCEAYGRQSTASIAEHVARVLQPHQTIHERNLSLHFSGGPLWLRSCYDPSLEDVYNEVFYDAAEDESIVAPGAHLNNRALYNFGNDWLRVLDRLPAYCDMEYELGGRAR